MTDLQAQLELKARLPRTWPAFFARHGSFTATQLAAIPPLLDGANVMLCAPTAGGKTAAVLAPLIERHCPPVRPPATLRILYLTPTRALVNDLHARLAPALELIGVTLGVKTRDSAFRPTRAPDLLLSTPESLDSLLTSRAKFFTDLRAVVLDELHLFAGTARGDQLRVLLNRIRRIRAYAAAQGTAPDAALQVAALSATSAAPATMAAAYAQPVELIQVRGRRALEAEQFYLAPDDNAALRDYLATFRARGWRKALVFCNSRVEVEAYAAATRENSPFGSAVYVHYSNLEPQRRRDIETQFAADETAICFSSSTLELGIDIGSIDVVILIGPPGSPASFAQRIGRGNRRRGSTRVACFYRSALEELLFAALLAETEETRHSAPDQAAPALAPFRPSVAIQQIFSLIKQSPTAAVRLSELSELFAGMLSPDDLQAIVAQLRQRDYLKDGRPGEWRAGARLNKLYDEQSGTQVSLSIYSNIQINEARLLAVRDQHTGETVARVETSWFDRELMTLEGRPVNIEWYDGEALWVSSYQGQDVARQMAYRSARQLLSYELARLIPARLGLPPGSAPYVAAPEGWYWFHWLGDLYGRAALDLLRYRVAAHATAAPGLALYLPGEPPALPDWSEGRVVQYLRDAYRQYEPLLDLGPFQPLLPITLRRRAVVEQFDVPRFLDAIADLRLLAAAEALTADLTRLIE